MNLYEIAAKILLDDSDYENGIKNATKNGKKLANTLKKSFAAVSKASMAAVGATATAIGKVLYDSAKQYSEYEQQVGGVQKLYGTAGKSIEEYAKSVGKSVADVKTEYGNLEKAQDLVMQNANNAFKTSGMSANEYMDMATSFSASLINSLNGDTLKAAEQTDVAMRAISDNFNTFGGDIGMIQGAFQGFAKQNYTMLDNLKLGYGGTKTEMERLIADANKYAAANGKAADLSISSFSDIVTAIELIQEKQGVAGTTAREAATTIQGSLGMTKAAWENLVTGLSDKNADLGQLFDNLVQSGTTLVGNIIPVVKQGLTSVGKAITEVAPTLTASVIGLITDMLPELVSAAVSLVQSLVQSLVSNSGQIIDAAISIINTLVQGLTSLAPMLLVGALQIIAQLASGLGKALPTLLPAIVNIVVQAAMAITDPAVLGAVLQGAVSLMQGLVSGLLNSLPLLINAIPTIISNLVDVIVQNAPSMIVASGQLIIQLAVGLLQAIPQILAKLPEIVSSIAGGLVDLAPQLLEAGKSLAKAAWDGIKSLFGGKGKSESVDVASNFDFSSVQTQAQQTASNVSSALSGMNTTLDFSAATTSATTQFATLGTSATTAKNDVVTAFTAMGTEASTAMAAAASGSGADWSSITNGAKSAAKQAAASFKSLPNQFRAIWQQIKTIYNEVPLFFTRVFTVAKQNVLAAWNGVPAQFVGIWGQIKAAFNYSDAYNWGSHMMQNFINGINSKQSALTTAVQNAGKIVSNNLHHSHPDEGPLKDDYKWMPDMMNLFIGGIKQYTPKLHKTAIEAFDFSGMMQYPAEDYTFSSISGNLSKQTVSVRNATDAKIDTLINLLRAYLPQLGNQQIVLDDGTLVGAMLPQIDAELGQSYLYKLRGNA